MATLEMPIIWADEGELKIPLDLSEWVPVENLRDWAVSDIAMLDWANEELLGHLQAHPDFEPKAILNTMTLAYSIGIFGAEEIARHCSTNAEFRTVRPALPPVALELKQFRKENRGILKWTLANVVARALKAQFMEHDTIDVLPAGLRRYAVENATERLDIARHLDRREDLL